MHVFEKYFVIVLIVLGGANVLSAQPSIKEAAPTKINHYLNAGVRYTRIYNDYEIIKQFPHEEVGFGYLLKYTFVKNISIAGGLNVGLKTKRDPYFEKLPDGTQIIEIKYLSDFKTLNFILDMDNTLNSRNFFIEIPLLASVEIIPKLSLRLGGVYRYFFSKQEDSVIFYTRNNLLSNKREFSVLMDVIYEMGNRYSIGLNYSYGLTNLMKGYNYGYIDSQGLTWEGGGHANNTSLGISLQYQLTKRSN
ncbi:MAG: hypothetical protein OEX22_06380 [Cyclobacteriaceae bacterium]|nr:hypothetical protein [Cyclobacteriaceae bacterium]